MIEKIENIRHTRRYLLGLIKDLNVEQLNKIPAGFNNNIIWNVAHLISAQQGICYVRSGLDITIEEKYFLPYGRGTKPEPPVNAEEVEVIKTLFLSSLDQFEADYQNKVFVKYSPAVTPYGVELKNIDDAIDFLPFHEGLHTGYIMALKRTLGGAF